MKIQSYGSFQAQLCYETVDYFEYDAFLMLQLKKKSVFWDFLHKNQF